MTLLTEHLEAGWREFKEGERWVAERFFGRPGATASAVRVEADSSDALREAVSARQAQLDGMDGEVKDVITNDGTLVTDAQHEALKATGTSVDGAEKVAEPVPNEDEVKNALNSLTPNGVFYDPTEGSVDAPQVPADAADKGLSPEAVSASETGSGSADVSTDPTERALPSSFPPPNGPAAFSLPERDHAAVLADAAPSDAAESQSTQSDDDERLPDGSSATGDGFEHVATADDFRALEEQSSRDEAQAQSTAADEGGDIVLDDREEIAGGEAGVPDPDRTVPAVPEQPETVTEDDGVAAAPTAEETPEEARREDGKPDPAETSDQAGPNPGSAPQGA
jgi:hypothetical protein